MSASPPVAGAPDRTNGAKQQSSAGNLRSVFGLASPGSPKPAPASSRTSVELESPSVRRKKTRSERRGTADDTFIEVPDPKLPAGAQAEAAADQAAGARRAPLRMDAQDGPWSVSVAEHPHESRQDARAYTLYIKTPTHNLTLTRTALEVVELHNKLRDSHPATRLPLLPLDASFVPPPAPKRKSAFLSTLSRLASPAGKSSRAAASRSTSSPSAAPADENHDPFAAANGGAAAKGPAGAPGASNTSATKLAAYLTTLANDQVLRQARHWRRFVRVRTDDLESVRVERAIKRVRSDLASHVSPKGPASPVESQIQATTDGRPSVEVEVENLGFAEENDGVVPAHPAKPAPPADERPSSRMSVRTSKAPAAFAQPASAPAPAEVSAEGAPKDSVNGDSTADAPSPAPGESHAPRIPRSLSAEPAKAGARLSRAAFSAEPDAPEPATTDTEGVSETGDDESASSGVVRRKSRKARSRVPSSARKSRKVVVDDFEMLRVLGKGCAGKVLLVRHKGSAELYALKAITKRHVLAHQELQHTLTEQAVLKRMAADNADPFVVKLWWSFHDKENLFLVMDFHPGGDLATQLARWGRLGRDRARFYAAEIVEGVEGLHAAGVIYRDLKPENVLIGGDGHIVLTDFGLSKEFPRRTAAATAPATPSGTRGEFIDGAAAVTPSNPPWMKKGQDLMGWPGEPVGQGDTTSTFCGTAEYLAPEVIQGLPYSYEVDWWSFGTMLYEMLTGITPFWANNHADMYVRVLQDELQFPDDRTMDQDTKSVLRGLLQRNPALRLSEPRIKKHPYFSMIDWTHVYYKRYIPPYIPPIDPQNAGDVQNFDETFLEMRPVVNDPNDVDDATDTDRGEHTETDAERTDGESAAVTPSQSRSPSVHPEDDSVDVFDGYSFKGRHSVIIDDEEESGEDTEEEAEGVAVSEQVAEPEQAAELEEEPKTPEARPTILPEPPAELAEATLPEPVEPVVQETAAAEVAVPEPTEPEAMVDTAVPRAPEDVPLPADDELSPLEPAPLKPILQETVPAKPAPLEPASLEPAPLEPAPAKAVPKESAPVKPTPPASVPSKSALPESVPPPAHPSKEASAEDHGEAEDVVPPMNGKAAKGRATTKRREKSGVPALDRFLSEEDGGPDLDDDDWDFVEAGPDEERNGAKGNSLFARGVVDRYRLSVFRKGSTPQRITTRSVSGASNASTLASPDGATSPSPTTKPKRGRNPGLTFRRHPKEFLRAKSPASAGSSSTRLSAQTLHQSVSQALSTASSGGPLTPSPSVGASGASSAHGLRTKDSTLSVGTTPTVSSDQSADHSPPRDATVRSPGPDENGKNKKALKKGAEKVLALFSPQR